MIQIAFIKASESVSVDELKNYQLHIITGGFEKKTLRKKLTIISATYDSDLLLHIPKR